MLCANRRHWSASHNKSYHSLEPLFPGELLTAPVTDVRSRGVHQRYVLNRLKANTTYKMEVTIEFGTSIGLLYLSDHLSKNDIFL